MLRAALGQRERDAEGPAVLAAGERAAVRRQAGRVMRRSLIATALLTAAAAALGTLLRA